jgi:RNA polymerase sigma factor (sigma-70 family)
MLPVDDLSEQAGDIYRDRFESCFREHHARLLAFAMRRVSSREAAEDVVADTFAVVWRRRDCVPDDAVLPWLYAIAANVIASQYRSTRRDLDLDLRLAHEASARKPDSDPTELLALRETFSNAFANLTEQEREVLRLVAWDGRTTTPARARRPGNGWAKPPASWACRERSSPTSSSRC